MKQHFSDWKTPLKAFIILVLLMALLAKCTSPKQVDDSEVSIISVDNGETIQLTAEKITKIVDGKSLNMYGYNGEVPGPMLKVSQDSEITVEFTNNLDENTTIHWHGIRLDNQFDGVPDVTQPPVQPGESFTYKIKFLDPGLYWYHPHIREDRQQDKGLYGNILVTQRSHSINREEILILDDMLIQNGIMAPHGDDHVTYALSGRFGNVLLVNAKTEYNVQVKTGEVVRFYLTNVANTRTFKISFDAKMKLIASDVSAYEREQFVQEIVIAPAERYIVDVLFEKPGTTLLMNTNPYNDYTLGTITVVDEPVGESYRDAFHQLNEDEELQLLREEYAEYFTSAWDYQCAFCPK